MSRRDKIRKEDADLRNRSKAELVAIYRRSHRVASERISKDDLIYYILAARYGEEAVWSAFE